MLSVVLAAAAAATVEVVSLMVLVYDAVESSNKYCGLAKTGGFCAIDTTQAAFKPGRRT